MQYLLPRLHEPEIRALLAHAVGSPTPEKIESICQEYSRRDNWVLLGQEREGQIVGCIGLEIRTAGTAVILHIAVAPSERGQGVGRGLIKRVLQDLSLRRLEAETDADALAFYQRCGFDTVALGKNAHGVERFHCVWQYPPHPHGDS